MERMDIFTPEPLPEAEVLALIASAGEEPVLKLRQMMTERWTLGELHGVHHWDRVLRNGMLLSGPGVDCKVVAYFAYTHDACRQNDDEDREHGPRAVALIDAIRDAWLGDLSPEQLLVLKKAVAGHTVQLRTEDPTVNACFDADRLDLLRAGIIPDPARMASAKGAALAQQIRDALI